MNSQEVAAHVKREMDSLDEELTHTNSTLREDVKEDSDHAAPPESAPS